MTPNLKCVSGASAVYWHLRCILDDASHIYSTLISVGILISWFIQYIGMHKSCIVNAVECCWCGNIWRSKVFWSHMVSITWNGDIIFLWGVNFYGLWHFIFDGWGDWIEIDYARSWLIVPIMNAYIVGQFKPTADVLFNWDIRWHLAYSKV